MENKSLQGVVNDYFCSSLSPSSTTEMKSKRQNCQEKSYILIVFWDISLLVNLIFHLNIKVYQSLSNIYQILPKSKKNHLDALNRKPFSVQSTAGTMLPP